MAWLINKVRVSMCIQHSIDSVLRALYGYGRLTPWHGINYVRSYQAAQPHFYSTGNYWSSTEYSTNNAANMSFGTGNLNDNNKYNANTVRPAVAPPTKVWLQLRSTIQMAFEDCRRGKNSSRQCQEYLSHADEDLDILTTEILEATYKPTTSTCFLVHYPKLREVFAAAFRDRIIHHWICLRLNPLFERININLGNVSHNCRKGFGTRSAVESVSKAMKYVSYSYGKEAYVFKGDLVGFFMSIPKRRMCDLLLDFTVQAYDGDFKEILLRLIEVVVMHNPEENCVLNSRPSDWKELAGSKSLFRCGEGRGAPIGNLTTQLFANFYMAQLDMAITQAIKDLKEKKIRAAYHRFVDDFVIICSNKSELKKLVSLAKTTVTEMGLKLHRDKRYFQPVSHGVLFVGAYIKNHRIYVSNRTLGRFQNKVRTVIKFLSNNSNTITLTDLEHIRDSLNSYLGLCKSRRSTRICRRLIMQLLDNEQFRLYFHAANKMKKIVLRPKHKINYM